jgi:hypothetical protein
MPAATGWGDHRPAIPASTQRQLRGAAARAGAAGQRPPGRSASAEKACEGAVLVAASALAGRIPAPWPGTLARGVRPVIGGAAVRARGVSAWRLVAGVGVDVSLSAMLRSSSATYPAAVKPFTISFRITVPRHFYVRRYPLPCTPLTGAKKRAVLMGGWRCRL